MDEVDELIEQLKNGAAFVKAEAAVALVKIGKAAVPALIEMLKDESKDVQGWVDLVLGKIVRECKTTEGFEEIEKGIDRGSAALRKGRVSKDILIDAQMKIAKLTREIAKRKDKLAPKRDLLLDGKPKPPKKGGKVYRTMTAIRR